MNIHVVAFAVSVAIFLFVIDLVRRRRLTFKYAVAWLFVSAGAIFFAIFYRLIFLCAAWLGFELPSNFIFFVLCCVFVTLSLLLTVFLCQQNNRNDIMAQKIALLEFELKELKKELKIQKNFPHLLVICTKFLVLKKHISSIRLFRYGTLLLEMQLQRLLFLSDFLMGSYL